MRAKNTTHVVPCNEKLKAKGCLRKVVCAVPWASGTLPGVSSSAPWMRGTDPAFYRPRGPPMLSNPMGRHHMRPGMMIGPPGFPPAYPPGFGQDVFQAPPVKC